MKTSILILMFGVLGLIGQPLRAATLTMPAIFGDNMVLQQGCQVHFRGKAEPGAQVTVAFQDKSVSVQANLEGAWKAQLGPFPPGGPHELTVISDTILRFKNVLVGEVWLASGQSNMSMSVEQVTNGPQEVAQARHPELRVFQMFESMQHLPNDDVAGKWVVCSPETIAKISAVAYFFGRDLQESLKTPVGMVVNEWGATPAQAWTPREVLRNHPMFRKIVTDYEAIQPSPPLVPTAPGVLYNGMIAPAAGFSLKGFIWFQGESDALAGKSKSYQTLLPLLIESWRSAWGQKDIPFLIVQLANFLNYTASQSGPYVATDAPADGSKPLPGNSTWAELREAQALTARQPGNGMVVTADIGDPREIHFGNKQEVGRRLALLAQAKVYGQKVVCAGPTFERAIPEGKTLRVQFSKPTGKLILKGGDTLRGFAIAGNDQKFVWANARIDRGTVILWHPDIPRPVAVRYNWANNPDGNLFDESGLPAEPFRSDDWPGITN